MPQQTAFWLAAVASIILWGAYPSALVFADFPVPLLGAAVAIGMATVGWLGIILVQGVGPASILAAARSHWRLVTLSGCLFALELALFFPAVKRSPETAAVLFELWVVSFVITSMLLGGGRRLNTKDWTFLIFGFCGATIAVVDWASIGNADLGLIDPLTILMALVAAAGMGIKTYLNSRISSELTTLPPLSASTIPHFLSAFIALPIWAGLFVASNQTIAPDVDIVIDALPVVLIYLIGVPVFILAVRLRPSETSMAVFYSIPLVALFFLSLINQIDLSVYFLIGAAIIFVANALLTQRLPYVSASGLAAILALMATWLAISIEEGHIVPFFDVSGVNIGISSAEAYLVFYGLIFAFVLTDILGEIKDFRICMHKFVASVGAGQMPAKSARSLYRKMLRAFRTGNAHGVIIVSDQEIPLSPDQRNLMAEIFSRSLRSTIATTPYAVFRLLSGGFLVLVFTVYCLSSLLVDRVVGITLFTIVSYFLFFSRDGYLKTIVLKAVIEEAMLPLRSKRYKTAVLDRQSNHRLGLALLVFSLLMAVILNASVETGS